MTVDLSPLLAFDLGKSCKITTKGFIKNLNEFVQKFNFTGIVSKPTGHYISYIYTCILYL